jgi:DNA-binding NarL/FixJ family response regulator
MRADPPGEPGPAGGTRQQERRDGPVSSLPEPVGAVRLSPAAGPAEPFRHLRRGGSGGGPDRTRAVLAEDSALFREGLTRLLTDAGYDVVATAADAGELLAQVRSHRPDVVVTDIRMPPTHTTEGLVAALQIRSETPDVAVVVLSQYVETTYAVKLLGDNPRGVGYLLKDRVANSQELCEAIQRVVKGGSVIDPEVVAELLGRRRGRDPVGELTDREREILALMAEGRSNQAIGERLYLSSRTVETHVAHIFTKLGLPLSTDDHRRVLAVLAYLRS